MVESRRAARGLSRNRLEDLFSTPNTDQIELLRFNKLTVQKFQVLGTGNDESEASRWAHVNYIGLS